MEAAQEEAILRSKENNTHVVIKGKRTKRQRPRSPIPSIPSITANSPSHVDPDGEGGGGGGGGCDGGDQSNDITNDNMASFSPATSAEILQESTEEEEDMANCLILLAQGQSRESPKQVEEDHADGGGGVYKFNSRRFLEAAATGTGKAGYYVYECKTCNRTFPSFQALGGHRASHKKPKAMAAAEERERSSKQFLLSSDDDQEAQSRKNDLISSLSLQLSTSRGLGSNNNRSKVHECSVCGAEFTSGQALGGHMRRHRAPNMGTNTTLSFTSPSLALEPDHHHDQETKKPRQMLSLDLDLNLPAPEDDHREPKFPFATKQQQQQQQQKQQQPPLVFSARTLVDCHY